MKVQHNQKAQPLKMQHNQIEGKDYGKRGEKRRGGQAAQVWTI